MQRPGRNLDIVARLRGAVFGAGLISAALTSVALFGGCGSRSRSPEDVGTVPPARLPPHLVPVVQAPPQDAGRPGPEVPRALSLDAFSEGERITDLAGLPVGDHILLAWVTYFDEMSAALRKKKPGRAAPKATSSAPSDASKQGATVMVRALDKDGEALTPPKVVSVKAVSLGGIGLAATSRGDVGLAWVGKDAGLGQVFVTRLSDTGDKQAQKMVTHSKTGCSDVAIGALDDGFVVAWIESKNDRADIMAAKIGRDLAPVGGERRVAEAKGEASDVRLLLRKDEMVVLWNETRVDAEGGFASARVLTADLGLRGDPELVVPVQRHARALEVARFGDGWDVGWVEDAPPGTDAGVPNRSLFLARLDAPGRKASRRILVPIAADPSTVALDCDQVCRVVVPVAERGELALYGFSYDSTQAPGAARRLAGVAGVSTEDTSPILVKDWLFFAEDNLRGAGRIRKVKLVW